MRSSANPIDIAVLLVAISAVLLAAQGLWFVADHNRVESMVDDQLGLGVELQRVALHIEDSVHYQISKAPAEEEWQKLVPLEGHSVRITNADNDNASGPYTVAMFHQLGCLDVIRRDYVARGGPSSLARHCLNYLRQSILCLADTRIEPVTSLQGPGIVNIFGDYVCRDWTSVYSAIENLSKRAQDAQH